MSFIGDVETILQVDANNNIIGSLQDNNRYEHTDVITRGTIVLIFDEQGNVLLQQRSGKKYSYPHYWDCSVGGVVKEGQASLDCAVEELEEEIGLEVEKAQLEDKGTHFIEHQVKEFVHIYVLHRARFVPQPNWEVAATTWKSIDEVRGLIDQGEKLTPVLLMAITKATGVKL